MKTPLEKYPVFINDDAFTNLPDGRSFAVSGLTGKSHVYVHRTVDFRSGSFVHSPQLFYSVQKIEVNNPPLARATNLRLPSAVWQNVSAANEARMKEERIKMRSVLEKQNGPVKLNCWKTPLKSSTSSLFASPRTLPSGKSYYHTGLDLRAAVGYPVRAPAASTVVVADEFFVPGRMVVLDHGGGLYSRYMHLNSFSVKVGDVVQQGQEIGRSGATGRVEAPHLHWEVLWKGNYASPAMFLQAWEQICDPKLGV